MPQKHILFSLLDCEKCEFAKSLLSERKDIEYVELSKDIKQWTEEQKAKVEAYDVFLDLTKTAPILVSFPSEKKYIGYLQIKQLAKSNFKEERNKV